jgi:catechol 2,3-dioxygenase-like lactoylglutathione lyase family enzyme
MKIRIARHTNDLDKISNFYTKVLGLDILGNFINHDGYDGIFLGKKGYSWELEFTQSHTKAEHSFDEDDILVFYPTKLNELIELNNKFTNHNIKKVEAKNPYWQANGTMYLDPDGYRIVISGIKI